ncbi:MAG: hypothetical protein ACE5FD_07185, partial [Anaerolineae bacterium]
GKIKVANENIDPSVLERLPSNVDPAQVLGGERYPVQVRVVVDGQTAVEDTYRPRGIRREGAIYGMEQIWLAPGSYEVQVWLIDDETDWRSVFTGPINVAEGEVRDLLFDESEGIFHLRQ